VDNRQEVREFLTTRRARITPDQAGLPTAGARRVPGLRRSEVATIAGLSVEYYARLERGQIAGASTGVLEALARALQLDDTERAHLLDLARAADGIPTSGRPRRRTTGKVVARLSLQWALDAIKDGVAFVRDPHQNLLATNALGRAFYSPVIGDSGRTPNLARFQFLDRASRDFYPDWDLFAQMCVGIMRAEAGRDPHDRGLQDLVSVERAVRIQQLLCLVQRGVFPELRSRRNLGALGLVQDGFKIRRQGNRHPTTCPCNTYPCADGEIWIYCLTEANWQQLARLMTREDLITHPDYKDHRSRYKLVDQLDAIVGKWSATSKRDDLVALLLAHNIPCAPVREIDEVAADPELPARHIVRSGTIADQFFV